MHVRDEVAERVRGRRRHEVARAQQATGLGLEIAQHVERRVAPRPVERRPVRAGERHRVQLDAADEVLLERELHERADLVVVDAAREHRQQRRVDVVLLEQLEHAQLAVEELAAEHLLVRACVERVERQHDARAELREPLEDALVLEEPQAVRRQRDPMDALLGAQLEDALERRVLRRLAAGEVDDAPLGVRLAEVARGSRRARASLM